MTLRIFLRTFLIQSVWNYQSLMSVGFAYCLKPIAARIFDDLPQRASFLKRQLSFFNAHPYFASYAIGAVGRMEEDKPGEYELIERFKNALIGPLGVLGDELFWGTIKPGCVLLAMIGVLLIENAHLLIGYFFVMLVCYNLPHVRIRFSGLRIGYREGLNVYKLLQISRFNRYRIFYRFIGALSLGFVIGFCLPEYGQADPMLAVVFGASICGSYLFHKWKHSFYRNTILIITTSIVIGIIAENL